MKERKHRDSGFLRRFFLLSLIISVVPVILLAFLAEQVFHLYRDSAVEQERQRVSHAVNTLDAIFGNAENIYKHAVLNEQALSAALYWQGDPLVQRTEWASLLRSAQQVDALVSSRAEEPTLQEVLVVQPENGVIISSEKAVSGLYVFYLERFSQRREYEIWRARTFAGYGKCVLETDRSGKLYLCVNQRDKRVGSSGGFALLLRFDTASLMASTGLFDTAAGLILTDNGGEVLSVYSGAGYLTPGLAGMGGYAQDGWTGTIDGVRCNVIGAPSSSYPYSLYAICPSNALFARQIWAERLFYGAMAAVLAGCLASSYLTARRHAKPLAPLVELVPTERMDYQATMQNICNTILTQREQSQRMLSRHSTMTRRMLLEKVIEVPFVKSEQIDQVMSMCQIDLAARAFIVLLIRLEADEAQGATAGYVYDLCVNLFTGRGYVYLSRAQDVAILFKADALAPGDGMALAEEVDIALCDLLDVPYRIGVGSAVDQKERICSSYLAACEALARGVAGERIACYDQQGAHAALYAYSQEVQNCLIRQLKAGKEAGVKACLDGVFENNAALLAGAPSPAMLLLVSNVIGTVHRALSEMDRPGTQSRAIGRLTELSGLMSGMSARAIFAGLMQICAGICREVDQDQMQEKKALGDRVRQYIAEYYPSPDASAEAAAQACGLSTAQLMQLCREVFDASFTKLLESHRLEMAAHMIERGERTSMEIGEAVGYLSYTSFSRAFKRVYGVPPNEYRRMLEGKDAQESNFMN